MSEFSSNVSLLLDFKKTAIILEEGTGLNWSCSSEVWDSRGFVMQCGRVFILIKQLAMISVGLR